MSPHIAQRTRAQDAAIEEISLRHGTVEIEMGPVLDSDGPLAILRCDDGWRGYVHEDGRVVETSPLEVLIPARAGRTMHARYATTSLETLYTRCGLYLSPREFSVVDLGDGDDASAKLSRLDVRRCPTCGPWLP